MPHCFEEFALSVKLDFEHRFALAFQFHRAFIAQLFLYGFALADRNINVVDLQVVLPLKDLFELLGQLRVKLGQLGMFRGRVVRSPNQPDSKFQIIRPGRHCRRGKSEEEAGQ